MRQLNGVYTQARNKRRNKTGHLFQGRYKAILIQKDSHLLEVCRYVVLNPVRAKMVEKPEDWKWSSYRATAGKEKPHPCLTTDWVLGQFSGKRDKAEQEYRQFAKWGINEKSIMLDVKAGHPGRRRIRRQPRGSPEETQACVGDTEEPAVCKQTIT